MKLLKAIDHFFFLGEGTIEQRISFYTLISFILLMIMFVTFISITY